MAITSCPIGMISMAGNTTCTFCTIGKYAATSGSKQCSQCGVGMYTSLPGRKSCPMCPAGSYTSVSRTGCISCPSGTYSIKAGAGSSMNCTQVPAGSYPTKTIKLATYNLVRKSNWWDLASSWDFSQLVATVSGDYIYKSVDSGVSWTKLTNSGSRSWRGITASYDFTKYAACVYNNGIYLSVNSGGTWKGLSATSKIMDWNTCLT